MNRPAKLALVFPFTVAIMLSGQSSTEDRGSTQRTRAQGYWTDPSTGLMWAGKDNGKDVSWHKAVRYCRELRLGGYSDWTLATLAELGGIYDRGAKVRGLAGPPLKTRSHTWHIKGNLFLTGNQWSSSRASDYRGRPSGVAWSFNFDQGLALGPDELFFHAGRRALCLRSPGE